MSVEQIQKPRAAPRGDTRLVQYEEYIDRQVESTRRVVKFVDLATSLVVLSAGVLAYLLAVAVVEHWLVPGGFSELGRLGLFLLLAWGVGSFAIRRLWPLVVGRVNPVYAAHAIELSGPSLKNSLVNLLLFRQKRSEISDAVYHTLEEQAAQRLSRVPLDAAVDRTALIRFGYLLVAIVALAALYKVLSPKDPIVAARRVLMPWAQVAPASRVKILDVKPGAVTVARGEFLEVSAEVRGVGDDENVVLRFTTADGQAVDQSAPMRLSPDELRYKGRLPAADTPSGGVGLAQDAVYRIEAGDARTLDYAVKVVEAPSMLVERVHYDYPEYTGYVDRQVEELGDIRAIEGTRITIHARANGPIREAHVDFDADGRRELTMRGRNASAEVSFPLALREDRRTPLHASYVLRFTNADGRPNRNPVKHSIDVDPDYAPEASLLTPREKVLDVRLDETVIIEVEARDPDFALADVRLRGTVQGREALTTALLKAAGHRGRFAARYSFTPSAHGLKPGDVVDYWVAASDNRTPEPNLAESPRQQFRIVSPDPQKQPDGAPRDPQQGQQGQGQGEQQPENGKEGQGEQQGQQQDGADGQAPPNAKQEPQPGGEGQKGEAGQEGQPPEGGQQQGDSRQNGQQGGPQNAAGDISKAEDQPAGQEPSEQNQQPGKQSQPGQPNGNDKQTGAGAAGGEPSNGAQPDGARRPDQGGGESAGNEANRGAPPSDADQSGKAQDGKRQSGERQAPREGEQTPVSSDGDNDGEAFERIQKHLDPNGQMKDGESPVDQNRPGGETPPAADQKPSGKRQEQGRQEKAGGDQKPESQQQQQGENQAGQQKPGEQGEGPGAETKGGEPQSAKEQAGEKTEKQESPGGQQSAAKGESGAGEEQEGQGAPNSKPEMKPGEKRPEQPSPGEQTNSEEPPAGARGKKESDSQGEQGGDRAGGGEEGGGQKAPREGTGSAGQNQAAEEGGGESGEKGAGNDSQKAGKDAAADRKTGQPGGETTGRGSKTSEVGEVKPEPAEQGAQDSGQQDDPLHRETPTSEKSEAPDDGEKAGERHGAEGEKPAQPADEDANQAGAPTGSGGERGTALAPPHSRGTAPEGDAANLEYARKQTDLVLEKLSDQLDRKKIDQEMLKELGWSEDDLRKFVDRWRGRKKAAEQRDASGEAAKRELDEALRSLGLRRGPMKQGQVKDDMMRDLREGYRGPVPREYQERLRAYNQGVSRARTENE